MIETFADSPASRWRFFTDTVMGGVSSGRVQFGHDHDRHWARMTGTVSTENNGGFIQMQRRVEPPLPTGSSGVRLVVRGNDQPYFIHLRRTGMASLTAFYRASFDVTSEWRESMLPFSMFTVSSPTLPARLEGASIASIGIVGFGRAHSADISVSEISIY